MSISDIINWFIAYYTSKMPGNGRGRPQSAWWSHFEMVEGDIFKDVDIYMIFLLLGNFWLERCLHCNKLVRRGKDGCTSREASNSGMAAHMRSKHAGQGSPEGGPTSSHSATKLHQCWEAVFVWRPGGYWPPVKPFRRKTGPDPLFEGECPDGKL